MSEKEVEVTKIEPETKLEWMFKGHYTQPIEVEISLTVDLITYEGGSFSLAIEQMDIPEKMNLYPPSNTLRIHWGKFIFEVGESVWIRWGGYAYKLFDIVSLGPETMGLVFHHPHLGMDPEGCVENNDPVFVG